MTLLNFNHIFFTQTSNTAITWLQDACVCARVCVYRKGLEHKADDWLIRFSAAERRS